MVAFEVSVSVLSFSPWMVSLSINLLFLLYTLLGYNVEWGIYPSIRELMPDGWRQATPPYEYLVTRQ